MRGPEIFRQPLLRTATEELASESFEDMVKFVVDLERNVICVGGGLHADEEQRLLEDGSRPEDLWGANYYLADTSEERYEFTSMINIRPSQGNTVQLIQSEDVRKRVRSLAVHFFESST